MVSSRPERLHKLEAYFKADAKAEGDDVVVAGIEVIKEGDAAKDCRWFSYRLTRENAAWAYSKEDEAYRVIAALELFATLLCVLSFVGDLKGINSARVQFSGVTDNHGNEGLIHKHMSSKFPLFVVLLELTEQLNARDMLINLLWQSRDNNVAADKLTNEDFSDVDPAKRICTPLESLPWKVLPGLMKDADILHKEVQSLRAARRVFKLVGRTALTPVKRKKRKYNFLKVKDPWRPGPWRTGCATIACGVLRRGKFYTQSKQAML